MRRAMQALPELAESQAIEERTKQAIGSRIIERLQERFPEMSETQLEVIARTMIQTTLSMIELSTQVPTEQRESVLQELRTLMVSYLSSHFRPRGPETGRP